MPEAIYYAAFKFVKTRCKSMDIRIIRDYYLNCLFKELQNICHNNAKMYYYIITGILLMMIFYSMAVFILNGS